MAIPKEPRQMMINMMYLVLTALLALNVSAEILNAFKIVDKGITNAKNAITTKNDITYLQLKKQSDIAPEKAKEAYENAQQAKTIAASLDKEIQRYKELLTKESGGVIKDGPHKGELENDKDMEAGVRIFIEENDAKNGKALQKRINEDRKKLYALIPKSRQQRAVELEKKSALRADDFKEAEVSEEENKWYFKNFHMVPVVASLAILNGIQQNVKTAEADVISECLMSIGADDFKFDTLVARVVPENTIITEGGTFKAHVFLSAFDSKANPEIFVGGSPIKVEGGEGLLTQTGGAAGDKKYAGEIQVKDPNGKVKSYKFDGEYQVIKPFASVSPDKMNVFYIGVENPVTVTAAGFTADKIQVGISQGNISGTNGKYAVTQTIPGTANVTVTGTSISGKDKRTVNIGSFPFRVKEIPAPIPKIGNQAGGSMPAGLFKAQGGMQAVLENFEFDYKYQITKFDCSYIAKRQDIIQAPTNNGAIFSTQIQGYMSRCKPGDIFYFENIWAQGPGGKPKKLPAMSFKLT